jgi:hypothetical protein
LKEKEALQSLLLIFKHEKQLLVLSFVYQFFSLSFPFLLLRSLCSGDAAAFAVEVGSRRECEEEQFDVWQLNFSIVCIRWRRLEPTHQPL